MTSKAIHIPVSMLGESDDVLDRYRKLIADGVLPGMASILASRSCPALGTDTARQVGIPPLEVSCGKEYARLRKEEARRAGIAISDNSRYHPMMADSRRGADPNAWIHAGDGASTYQRRLRETGGGCEDLGVQVDLSRTAEKMEKKKSAFIQKMKRKYDQRADAIIKAKKK